MVVHLPGARIERFGDERWLAERLRVFGPLGEPFWERQERLADAAWDLTGRAFALPEDVASALRLLAGLRPRQLPLLGALERTLSSILPADAGAAGSRLRAFVDAQLFITAQSDAESTDLLYGATALDLAREGTFHVAGGIATISIALLRAFRKSGGRIAFNSEAVAIETTRGRASGVRLADGTLLRAKNVIAAIPVHDASRLSPELAQHLKARIASLPQRWSAFTLYCGLPPGLVPEDFAAHHQMVADPARPLGETNSVFASFSAAGERSRARAGGRAVTLSTHTDVARWERAAASGTLPELRARYAAALCAALDRLIPGASQRAELLQTGTPFTFARYTARHRGLVGGLPQTSRLANLHALGHRTPVRGLYLCGDTAFPGQSTVGATLSGTNAARAAGSAFALR